MGTGVGRFALEIAKTSLDTLMNSNFKALVHSSYVVKALIDSYNLVPQSTEVVNGSAVKLPHKSNSISIVITSPPYLPASSGREDYLIGKAISNIALNLMSDVEIEDAETKTVGSMKWSVDNVEGLPKSVYELYDWLINDELRSIKAKPTLAYYASLKEALKENFRVLLPNGLAIYVIGKESVFYRFSDREVLYKVECDKIFIELAKSCGFVIDEQINVELDKKNKNARPRSLDSYYESVFILRKP
jgi:ubiquinone/menaquinone biosynthesis C-methylase UbiE